MATSDRVLIELYVDDQGTVKIQNAKVAVEDLGQAGKQSFADSSAAADDFASALIKQLGIYALITGALYEVKRLTVDAFRAGLQEIDAYNMQAIAASSNLTNRSIVGIQEQQAAYGQYKAYVLQMYEALEAETTKHFSSGKDMISTFNSLSRMGIQASQQEAGAIGVITDQVRLLHGGMISNMEVQHEMYGVLQGYSGMHYRLAQMIEGQLGPDWHNLVVEHMKAGDVVAWMASLFPGLSVAVNDIQKEWTAQKTTLDTLVAQVGRAGLAGAYEDMIGLLKQANDYLREHKDTIAGDIRKGWNYVESSVLAIVKALAAMATETRNVVQQLAAAAENPLIMGLLGAAAGSRLGVWGAAAGAFGGANWAMDRRLKTANDFLYQKEYEGYETPLSEQMLGYKGPPVTPPLTKLPNMEGAGGGGGRDTTDTMENLILQLRQEQAKLTEGAFAGIDAWFVKMTEKMQQLAMDDKQLKEGMAVATDLKVAKEQAAEKSFQDWLGKANHDTTSKIIDDGIKALNNWGNTEQRRAEISDAINKQLLEDHQKLEVARTQETKKYYDSLASGSVLITDQYAWKERSLALEIQLNRAEQERWFVGKGLTDTEKDTYRQLQGLTDQVKAYNLARQKSIDLGTLEGWAIERAGEALKRDRASIKDMMTGMESFGANALGQAEQGILSQQKTSAAQMGKTIVQSMVLEMEKKSFTSVWDNIAKLLAPKTQSTLGMGGIGALGGSTGMGTTSISQITTLQQQAAQGSAEATKQLQAAAEAHQNAAGSLTRAGGGLDISGAQLGLSAGGLALSAIGVVTGSKWLIYAGTALEIAAVALQVAAMIQEAGGIAGILGFHGGGVVAHQGMILTAHSGLAPDEVMVKALRREWILNPYATASLEALGGPDTFTQLNSGRLPVLPLPLGNFTTPARQIERGAGGSSQVVQHHTLRLVMETPDGKPLGHREINFIMEETQKRIDHGELRLSKRK